MYISEIGVTYDFLSCFYTMVNFGFVRRLLIRTLTIIIKLQGLALPALTFCPDKGFNGYLQRLGEGEIYAFCLHNEALRILCDFGLVGLALVALRLWANCSAPVLLLLGVCMVTNSYLYSFSGALIASSLFNPKPVKEPRRLPALQPALQHA